MMGEYASKRGSLGLILESRGLVLGLLAALVSAAVIVGLAASQLVGAAEARREIAAAADRFDRLAETSQALLQVVTEAESRQRRYLLIAQEPDAEAALAARPQAEELLRHLARDAREGRLDLHQIPEIEERMRRRLELLEASIAHQRAGRRDESMRIVHGGEGAQAMTGLASSVHGLLETVRAERQATVFKRERSRHSSLTLEALLVVLIVVGFAVAAVSAVRGRLAAYEAAETLRALNADLTQAQGEAEAASASKSRFLAAASHDMRQPLHALSLYLASLDRRVETPDGRRILANMQAAVGAMTRMFSALLDLARLEAGVLRPSLEAFPLQPLLDDVAQQAREVERGSQSRVRVIRTRLATRTDPELLEVILRNLAINAVKYAGGGRILIGCRRTGDGVRIEVHDTGPGIAPERLQDLFGEFVRGDAVRSVEGLGLGLSIVDRLAHLLGHPLRVRSELGRGSVFSIDLPRAEAAPEAALDGPPAHLRDVRILVVDDEPFALDAMALALSDAGARVMPVASTAAALEALRDPFDLHVLDLSLAGDSGLKLLQEIEARRGGPVPALIVTGSTSPGPLNALRQSGRPWLTKPVSDAQLIAAASDLLTAPNDV